MKRSLNLVNYLGVIISLINLGFFLLMESTWIFVNDTVKLPRSFPFSFTELFIGIMIVFCLYFIAIDVIRIFTAKITEVALIKVIHYAIIVLEILFAALNIFLFLQMGNTKGEVFRRLLLGLPYLVTMFFFLYLTLIHPKTKLSRNKLLIPVIVLLVIILSLSMIVHAGKVKITSGPILQAIDSDILAVIWSTNVKSTGNVQYGPDEEHMSTAYEAEDGLINANTKHHKVLVSVKDMKTVVYRVESTKVNNILENSANFGNTVKSQIINYQPADKEEISFYVLNDVHSNKQIYKKFLRNKDYDFIVSNGDALEAASSFDVVINKFLKPVGQYTDHNKLLYFVRGNHETRGEEARYFKNNLALPNNQYYYSFQAGPVYAIVLDSGEDKLDNHKEYSGLVDFQSYKQEETRWLEETLYSSEYKAAKYHIVFIHIPLNNYIEQSEMDYLKTYESKWRAMLSEAGTDIAFSGHTHIPQFLKPEEYDAAFPTVIGGGDAWREKNYHAVKVIVTQKQMVVYDEKADGSKEEIITIKK